MSGQHLSADELSHYIFMKRFKQLYLWGKHLPSHFHLHSRRASSRRLRISLLSAALVMTFLPSVIAIPFPYNLTIPTDTEFDFHLRISGDAITEENDDAAVFLGTQGDHWTVLSLTLTPDDGFSDDNLTVSGTIKHNGFVAAGHNHQLAGDPWEFSLTLDAGDPVNASAFAIKAHGGHFDSYSATLIATFFDVPNSVDDEILDWAFDLRGHHICTEPSTRQSRPGLLVDAFCPVPVSEEINPLLALTAVLGMLGIYNFRNPKLRL